MKQRRMKAILISNRRDRRRGLYLVRHDGRKAERMSDLINRQAAIDAIKALWDGAPTAQHVSAMFDCEDAIQALPSAQPEIIRCKDCKHRYLENKVWVCPFGLPGGENFFCGYGAELYNGGQE